MAKLIEIPRWLFWLLIADAAVAILMFGCSTSPLGRWLGAGLVIGLLLAFGQNY